MSIIFGFIITIGSLIGGFTALGGNLSVIWQPWEYLIIAGMALGIYIIANPWKVVIDTGADPAHSGYGPGSARLRHHAGRGPDEAWPRGRHSA